MSRPQLEKKVEDYLRNSQALEDYWQQRITAEQLQAEITPSRPRARARGMLPEAS
jgi:hypothetical protein